jgi:hypothetical protein
MILTLILTIAASTTSATTIDGSVAAPAYAPSYLHQLEAASKAQALSRMKLAEAPTVLVDQSGFDAVYYRINLSINEITEQIVGVVAMTAAARVDGFDAPTLNLLSDMFVDSVTSQGQAATWSHIGGFLYVTLPETYAWVRGLR